MRSEELAQKIIKACCDKHVITALIDEAVEPLLRGLKEGRDLIYLLGSSPLELASKYGPDYEPPTEEEIVGQWQGIEDALAAWKHDNPAPSTGGMG